MGRNVAALVLAALVLAAPRAHAQTTPEEHTANELEVKARSYIISGSFMTAVGGALMIPGAALIGVQYTSRCENCGPSAPTFLIAGSIILGLGGLTLVPGAVLLSQGVRKKKNAGKLASGQATLVEVGEAEYLGPVTSDVAPAYVDDRMGKVQSMVNTGYSLIGLSLISATSAWLFLVGDLVRGLNSNLWVSFLVMMPVSVLMYSIGSPCLLSASARARHLVGLKPVDGLGIAGWVLYGNSLATGSLFFGGWPPYIAMAYSASLIAGAVVSLVAGHRAARIANEQLKGRSVPVTLVPSVTPLPGGISIGVAGAF